MDFLAELDYLALGSRLKRLSDQLISEVTQTYKTLNIDFNPRLFPLLQLLYRHGPNSISELSQALGVTHAAVSQMANMMVKSKLAIKQPDSNDERRQLLELTPQANQLYQSLIPLWQAMHSTLQQFGSQQGFLLLPAISAMEQAINQNSLQQAWLAKLNHIQDNVSQTNSSPAEIKLSGWQPEWREPFAVLNLQWLEHYFSVTALDKYALFHPEEYYLNDGGYILFAAADYQPIGTVALKRITSDIFELSKLAVEETHQQLGIGRRLMLYAISMATMVGAQCLVLQSNRQLKAALHLYRELGFKETGPIDGLPEFPRADIYMKKTLR
ncbi:bifunctional helix-turn-helix transcriptional regulator/GNAT family N-acetyltransferase [Zooshikella harenae]|uniref:MarR family transcriptional regulator/GNAT family N-acetyltransferase n=1 Tax=Zooshikella harenae TaxID=2827238 RepID=A0ABS5ZEF0_9GAMM|nr:bifunctional helix-turn-helix transcriptional regulator/GNAT family N-acetyltransferase [Zooshikella harenae]MBU2712446.1 MarR family transcriptional regulator/GNAT family N-acetyltransferase [Zooshikella harenae]